MQFESRRQLLRHLVHIASRPRLDRRQVAEVTATFVQAVADPDVPGMVRIGVRTTQEHSWTWTEIEALGADLLADHLRQQAHIARQQLEAAPPQLPTPDLLGLQPQEAIQVLAAMSLGAELPPNTNNEARVVDQRPPPLTPIKPGMSVHLTMSSPEQSSDPQA